MRRPSSDQRGATLLEIGIVLVLIGILSIVVIPTVTGSLNSLHINNAAQKLRSDIRYTRQLALSNHATYGIEFDTTDNTYRLFNATSAGKTYISDSFKQSSDAIDFDTLPECAGSVISTATRSEIRFNSFGVPLDSANGVIAYPTSIILSNNGLSRGVHVFEQTGYTQITTDDCYYTGKAGTVYSTSC